MCDVTNGTPSLSPLGRLEIRPFWEGGGWLYISLLQNAPSTLANPLRYVFCDRRQMPVAAEGVPVAEIRSIEI